MARSTITAQSGEVELTQRRTRKSRTFQKSGGGFRTVCSVRPIHWDDGGKWVDVDDAPISDDGGRTWRTTSTPYILNWNSETLTLSYQSKRGGDVRVRLLALDGVQVSGPFPKPTVNGQRLNAFIAPELEISFAIRSHGVEIFKILHGPSAPRTMTWEVIEGDLTNINFVPMQTTGRDNMLGSEARKQQDVLNRWRPVEIEHTRTVDNLTRNPGKKTYAVTERITGRTRFIDPVTRARTFVDEIEYPINVDVTVNESVVANADDGYSGTAAPYWSQQFCFVQNNKVSAWRFQAVDVPQGATIDDATLTINVTLRDGTGSCVISGEDVDDAAAWAHLSANSPITMTATTADTTFNTPASTGSKNIDVATSIQEIVSRAGWTNNADMRLGVTSVASMGTSYFFVEDYVAAGTAEADLTINYTAGGAVAKPKTLLLLGVG